MAGTGRARQTRGTPSGTMAADSGPGRAFAVRVRRKTARPPGGRCSFARARGVEKDFDGVVVVVEALATHLQLLGAVVGQPSGHVLRLARSAAGEDDPQPAR